MIQKVNIQGVPGCHPQQLHSPSHLTNVSLELRNVSLELRNLSLELRNVSIREGRVFAACACSLCGAVDVLH